MTESQTQITQSHPALIGKRRSPLGVAALSAITFGIYGIYWWYAINKELAAFGRGRAALGFGEHPLMSAIAFRLGRCLVVPYLWTAVTTSRRVRNAQRLVGVPVPLSVPLAVGLLAIGLVGCAVTATLSGLSMIALAIGALQAPALIYLQSALNRAWTADDRPATDAGQLAVEPAPA
jgi:Domain of unknown function (DUF4234)